MENLRQKSLSLPIKFAVLVGGCFSIIGCSQLPPAIRPPDFDPDEIATAALTQYDANSNGAIEHNELNAAASLKFSLERCDSNNDGQISHDEIASFVQTHWIDESAGMTRVKCAVNVNGRPLDGATVSLIPEDFLNGAIRPASGVTRGGIANLDMAEEDRPNPNAHGVQTGLYRVRISKVVNGTEQIPAKFNENTELGCEVAGRAAYMPGPMVFDLKIK